MAAVQIRLAWPQGAFVDAADRLEEAVTVLREHWNEDEGPQVFLVLDEGKRVLATLMRHETDPELCVTTYADGRVELHRCVYILRDGWYDHTAVTAVA
jgi:hypothetical protein